MSDRLARRFAAIDGRAALITFVCGGDPTPELMPTVLDALVAGGADIIEIGMPFTDPMADGPSVQAGNIRALMAGITLRKYLEIVADFRSRDQDTPLILMGYLNPILAYGPEDFARDARAAGLDGCIVADLSPEEAPDLAPALAAQGLHLIRLTAPTTDAARLPAVLDGASGFLYHVAIAGVTGSRSAAIEDVAADVARIKQVTNLPVGVGFGVRTPEQAAATARVADAVIVGSAIVDVIGEAYARQSNDLAGEIRQLVADLATAVRSADRKAA